ncbi:hypothetical protein [Bdellovibrio svalbardensis]|uniref:Uncharacterized protein n=1 Tax=Bdellovibrio svalbardensis TaxID=2972972 RepID=A0ABT6DPL3_9BACT|nr:hypothetical protein [Bdellovibrio svalbardensis]MDG0817786.1 hypothetical protein [Bdellovibrio svalbardensis]
MKYRFLLSAFFFFVLPVAAQAEYRVFLLQITKRSADPAVPPASRLVESTLDHIQYRYFYQVDADEDVTYIATWRCRGRTDDFKAHCPNPRQPAADGLSDQKTRIPQT